MQGVSFLKGKPKCTYIQPFLHCFASPLPASILNTSFALLRFRKRESSLFNAESGPLSPTTLLISELLQIVENGGLTTAVFYVCGSVSAWC